MCQKRTLFLGISNENSMKIEPFLPNKREKNSFRRFQSNEYGKKAIYYLVGLCRFEIFSILAYPADGSNRSEEALRVACRLSRENDTFFIICVVKQDVALLTSPAFFGVDNHIKTLQAGADRILYKFGHFAKQLGVIR
jgi:hypothetical protein